MGAPQKLTSTGRLYVYGVIAVGFAVLVAAVGELPKGPDGYYLDWLLLAALTAISGSATVKLPSIPASLSVSETFVFTSVLLFGPPAGTLTVALDGLIISLWLSRNRKEIYRLLFNIAAPAISIWVASNVFFAISGLEPLAYGQTDVTVNQLLLPLGVFTILFFSINSWMIAFAVALETGGSPFQIWRTNFMWLSLNFFCGASVAALLAVSVDPRHVDLTYLGAVVPLLLALYLTYRTAMGRVEDANQHLQRLNKLHLATIETLAHAVDAKDQVTHGHIRRVQNLTTHVAVALGVTDEVQLKAIEASALLHDMGKLAIPEHILNKPGKLTTAEFDKMKLHASIGAEILSSIEFPYPVVPIVRHHHENWDGSGYPDKISGVDIPIGARILSVVDCFDALTSDRPYRPALSVEAALTIVHERRGTMYDPLVVDTFERVQRNLTMPPVRELDRIAQQFTRVTESRTPQLAPAHAATGGDSLAVLRLLQVLTEAENDSWEDVADLIIHRLGASVKFTDCAVFLYNGATDRLVNYWSTDGPIGSVLSHAELKRGEGVSGWVAANYRTMLNSPISLDPLAAVEGYESTTNGYALSVPLLHKEILVGVLTVYRDGPTPFVSGDQEVLESISQAVAALLVKAKPFYGAGLKPTHGFPTAHHLDTFLRRRQGSQHGGEPVMPLLVLQLQKFGGATDAQQVAQHAAAQLRGGDVVFICDTTTVVCVLAASTEEEAIGICERLVETSTPEFSDNDISPGPVRGKVVCWPRDGRSLAALLEAADRVVARSVA